MIAKQGQGKRIEMPVLLVDDRDDRILAELGTREEAETVLEEWAAHDANIPRFVSIIQVGSRQDAIFESEGWIKIGPVR